MYRPQARERERAKLGFAVQEGTTAAKGERGKRERKKGKKALAGRERGARRPTLVGDTNLDAFVAY